MEKRAEIKKRSRKVPLNHPFQFKLMATATQNHKRNEIPSATYRIQFNKGFTFKDALPLVDYWHELGISHLYASPITAARKGSLHGYDVTDPAVINPEIGTMADLEELSARLRKKGMGLIIDIVPNHMCVADSSNRWWMDVLENGPSSPYAKYFDINWKPLKLELANKVLLPILGDQYGKVLEDKQIQIFYEDGAFSIQVYEHRLPLAPRTWAVLLSSLLNQLRDQAELSEPLLLELESILTGLKNLPLRTETTPEKVNERQREKEILKNRLNQALGGKPREALDKTLAEFNGRKGRPQSFDRLEALLKDQSYRLGFWQVAADEINYRRFFDINELAAIRVEDPEVFEAVHKLPLSLIKKGLVQGLRIDHVDGLFDPEGYLKTLRGRLNSASLPKGFTPGIFVEKIIEPEEKLSSSWPVQGTTGYDFLNVLNSLYVDAQNKKAFFNLYERFTGEKARLQDILIKCKKLIMLVSNASELHVLAAKLDRISEQHRWSRDFTQETLRFALREVIACFPVYRTYITQKDKSVSREDLHTISVSIKEAKRRNPSTSSSVFDFIGDILRLQHPPGLTEAQKEERRAFIMRFQQLTGPIMAKGLEDTAFYRFFPLSSLNEVGGDPAHFGLSVEEFHRRNEATLKEWPDTLVASTTHDTKRSEDVRARLNVLSEMPVKWYRQINKWRVWNSGKEKEWEGSRVPSANEEYLLYQTLVGTWPFNSAPDKAKDMEPYIRRVQEYMDKALKEAKVNTSWINPNTDYETALKGFIAAILKPGKNNRFLADLSNFSNRIARAGDFNSLSHLVLKSTSPGIPDFYQGTETRHLRLVDPDNRKPVDYPRLTEALKSFRENKYTPFSKKETIQGIFKEKLLLTRRILELRRENKELFSRGEYIPLKAEGARKNQVVAFLRREKGKTAVIIAARFFSAFSQTKTDPSSYWRNTRVVLPKHIKLSQLFDAVTSKPIKLKGASASLPLENVLGPWPAAILTSGLTR